jgi:nucleoside-triphosphatase THEP1
MLQHTPNLHSESDVAALVYGHADAPDAVLDAFVRDLQSDGVDAIGLLQHRVAAQARRDQPFDFVLISGREAFAGQSEASIPAAAQCGTRLQGLGEELSAALARRPDVVVLNRFGWLEANGSGLLNVLGEATDLDIPVVIAVPEALFTRWLSVTQGLAVRLACNRDSLDGWWRKVRRIPSVAQPISAFCERYK